LRIKTPHTTSLIAFLIFGLFTLAHGQDSNDLSGQRLLRAWVKGTHLPSGIVSLQTMKRATKQDDDKVLLSFFDLDGDGTKELAVQSECAPVGNCALAIYTRKGRKYRKILEADSVQTIEPLSVRHRKYKDLELGTHDTAFDTHYEVFRYSSNRYRRFSCREESWSYIDKKGELHTRKKPLIERGHCY
jgi:hypothetical protein